MCLAMPLIALRIRAKISMTYLVSLIRLVLRVSLKIDVTEALFPKGKLSDTTQHRVSRYCRKKMSCDYTDGLRMHIMQNKFVFVGTRVLTGIRLTKK